MANTKSIIIGSAPTYRGEYTSKAVYYRENVVSSYSCVFKAVANNFSNIPPIVVDEDGYISIANTAAWTCVVDNTKLYNLALQYKEIELKTINGESLFGSGNIEISGDDGSTYSVDSRPSDTSTNPLQNKVITSMLKQLSEKIDSSTGGNVEVQYWQSSVPTAQTVGERFYSTRHDVLYVCQLDSESGEKVWSAETPSVSKLYCNSSTTEWYKWNGTKMVGIGLGKIVLSQLDNVTDSAIASADAPSNYVVVNSSQYSVGVLTVYSDSDGATLTQILDTHLVLGSDGTLDENSYSASKINRYFRTYGLAENDCVSVGDWTEWKVDSTKADVDDKLDIESGNAISNQAVTTEFNKVAELIDNLENDVLYFQGYEDISQVTLEDIRFVGETGKIIYLVQQNVFALKAESKYYPKWSSVSGRYDSSWYNVEDDGDYYIRTDKFYCLVSDEQADPYNTVDEELSSTSNNPVRNSTITAQFKSISQFRVTITKVTAGDNGTYTAVCNQNISKITEVFLSGRDVVIVDNSHLKVAMKVLQVPYDGTEAALGLLTSGGVLYTFSMEGAIMTITPYVASSEESESSTDVDELADTVADMKQAKVIAYWGDDYTNFTSWRVGMYWYNSSTSSSVTQAKRLKKCIGLVGTSPTFEAVSDITFLVYPESDTSIKLYMWTGTWLFLLSDNPVLHEDSLNVKS